MIVIGNGVNFYFNSNIYIYIYVLKNIINKNSEDKKINKDLYIINCVNT